MNKQVGKEWKFYSLIIACTFIFGALMSAACLRLGRYCVTVFFIFIVPFVADERKSTAARHILIWHLTKQTSKKLCILLQGFCTLYIIWHTHRHIEKDHGFMSAYANSVSNTYVHIELQRPFFFIFFHVLCTHCECSLCVWNEDVVITFRHRIESIQYAHNCKT